MNNGLADDDSKQWRWKEGLVVSIVSVSPHCIHILMVSIDISVQYHVVTRTMSLASRAPN